MVTNRKTIVSYIGLLVLTCNVCAQISITEVRVPGVLTIGSYSQLIETLGCPNNQFASSINPISPRCLKEGMSIAPMNKVECEYLVYDAYEYVRVGDSVQLVFIDLRKTQSPIYIKDLSIDKSISQKVFLSIITKKGWWSKELSQVKTGSLEYHYCTHTKVKNYVVDYKEDPCSSVVFTFRNRIIDKRIWWIEFPIMRVGGIVH